MRLAVLLCLLLVAACAPSQPAPQPTREAEAAACKIGPDDGPVLVAERGIGGTGMTPFTSSIPVGSSGQPNPASGQNRGVGGTGMPAAPAKSAGSTTGIVGEITGFASICVNGVEVGYDPAVAIEIDGAAASTTALRAGQIVVITASPPTNHQDDLLADQVSVRHEVSGPVSEVSASAFTIAGQEVAYNNDTRGTHDIQPGEWITVSGLRNASGTILATRIDPWRPNSVTVHGTLNMAQGQFWIGSLKLKLPLPTPVLQPGSAVTVSGTLKGGALIVTSITPDLLFSDPTAYFGASTTQFLVESYVWSYGDTFRLSGGAAIALAPALAPPDQSRPAILSLEPAPGGGLRAVGQSSGTTGAMNGTVMGTPLSAVTAPRNQPDNGASNNMSPMQGLRTPGMNNSMPGSGISAAPGMMGSGPPPH